MHRLYGHALTTTNQTNIIFPQLKVILEVGKSTIYYRFVEKDINSKLSCQVACIKTKETLYKWNSWKGDLYLAGKVTIVRFEGVSVLNK